MLGHIHRVKKAAEMAGADGAAAEHRPQLQLDAGRKTERALRSDQDLREVARRRIGCERIQIVAADTPLHLWKPGRDLVGFALSDRINVLGEAAQG